MTVNIEKMDMNMADEIFLAETPSTTIPDGSYHMIVNKSQALNLALGTSEIITMYKQTPITWNLKKTSDTQLQYNITTPESIDSSMAPFKVQNRYPISMQSGFRDMWLLTIKTANTDGSFVVIMKYVSGSTQYYLVPGSDALVEGIQCNLGEERVALEILLKPI